jgi:NADPH2:quinone reductase
MRAVIISAFGPPENAAIGIMPDPVAGPGELLVEIKACAANYVDLLVFGGKYQFLPKLPFVPGKLPCGVVASVGPGVTKFAIGDRVLTMAEHGGYGEQIAVSENQCFRLPDSLAFIDAAAMSLAYDTAWMALRERGRLAPGETVLVLGATGAVGAAAVQLAKMMGARVLAGVSSEDKASRALSAGADGVVDLGRPDLRETLRAQIHAQTEGRGADVILDPVGGDVFDAALRALAWRGRLVVIGFAAGRIPSVKANYLLLKNIEVSGLQISDYRRRTPALMQTAFAEIFAAYEARKLLVEKSEVFDLADFATALRKIADHTATRRVVLQIA